MRYGPNRLPEGKKQTVITRFLLQFHNILVYILLAAAFVKMLTGAWLDAAVILSVVIINGVLGFLQEGRAEKALGSIRTMLSAEARCVRDGEVRLVPADLRLTEVKNLRTEEAALTGESVPADKTIEAVSGKATVGDRKGMAFSGTLVTSGRGRGVVVATGAGTELGRINQLMASVSPPRAVDRPIVNRFGIWRIAFVGTAPLTLTLLLFFHARSNDASDDLARTIAVNAIVIGQIFYLLNSRYKFDSSLSLKAHLGNPYLGYSIGAVVLAQALFTYAPPFQALFHTEGIPLGEWLWLLLGGLVFFLVVEAEKLVIRLARQRPSED